MRSSYQVQKDVSSRQDSHQFSGEAQAQKELFLRYTSPANQTVVSGSNDYGLLSGLKNSLLSIKNDYFSSSGLVTIKGDQKYDLDRRFALLEKEIDGLLRRRIEYTSKDYEGGSRTLDFPQLLQEKENQIQALQRAIENFEARLKRANIKEVELETKIQALTAENLSLRDRNLVGENLDIAVLQENKIKQISRQIEITKKNFASAVSLWEYQIRQLRTRYPNERFDINAEITQLLQKSNVQSYNVNGIETIEIYSQKTVQVPVQDLRTKELLNLFALNLKRLSAKYPKLLTEIDEKLAEFFQQSLINIIQEESLERVVEVIRYVPQIIRVENTYEYGCSKKSRAGAELELRTIIIDLLRQIEENQEINPDVLGKARAIVGFLPLPDFKRKQKVVQIEKIIQKVVQKVVQVPKVVPVEKIVEKIVEVPKIQQIQKIVHVPVEVVKVVDNTHEKIVEMPTKIQKIVEVPKVIQKIVEKVIQVPKIVEVQKIVQKVVFNTEVIEVEKPVTNVIVEHDEVVVEKEKIVPFEKIVEKIVQVPIYIEKVVEKIVEIPKVVEVEKIVQKVVQVPEIKVVNQTKVAVSELIQPVDRIVQKVVIVENVVERIVEVPQIVEKIVQRVVQVPTMVEIEKVVEKLVPTIQVKEIEVIKNIEVPLQKQVEKIVQKRIEVPIFHERIVKVPEIINQVAIEQIQVPKIIQIEKWNDKIITQTKIVEVEKPVVHYIKDVQVIKACIEKVVEIPRNIEKIKEVKVRVDKIIQKMVEIPKVVEVEKIVEKVVVVPRVIEKVVEVPQIVEVVVEKIVQKEIIREIQVEKQVIVQIEKPVQIQVTRNIYVQIEKPVEKIVEKVVPIEKVTEKVELVDNIVEKIIPLNHDVPKEIIVQKIVPLIVENQVFVEVEKPITLTVEVPVQVEKIIQKPIKIQQIIEKVVQIPQIIEKVVQVQNEKTQIEVVEQTVQKIVQSSKTNVMTQQIVVVQQKFNQIENIVQKIVPVKEIIREQVPIQQIIEKIVQVVVQVPKVVEIEKIVEKMVEKQQVVEIQVLVPQLVKVSEIIKEYVDRIIEVPLKQEVLKEVPVQRERIVQVIKEDRQIVEVPIMSEKVVQVEKVKQYTNVVNSIEKEVQVVDRFERTEVPVFSTVEKIVEVPTIIEKIAERVVILPQVVEVLKYVHEICECEGLGVGVEGEIQINQAKYRELYGNSKKQLDILLGELKKLSINQPNLRPNIELVERFLIDFDKLAAVQRIVSVPVEKIVQKEVPQPVLVPTQANYNTRNELALSLLIEKLIIELKRIKNQNPNIKMELEEDIVLLFFSELYGEQSIGLSSQFKANLQKYTEEAIRKYQKSGGQWTNQHETILNTVLSERFVMANAIKQANLQIQKAKALADAKAVAFREKDGQFQQASEIIRSIYASLEALRENNQSLSQNSSFLRLIDQVNYQITTNFSVHYEPTKVLGQVDRSGEEFKRILSLLREKDSENEILKSKVLGFEREEVSEETEIIISGLKLENVRLREEIDKLRILTSSMDDSRYKEIQIKLKTKQSRIQELQSELRMSQLLVKQLKEGNSSAATSRGQPLTSSRFSSPSSSRYVTAQQPSYAGTSEVISSGLKTSGSREYVTSRYEAGNTSTSYEQSKRLSFDGEGSGNQGYRSSYKSGGYQSPTSYQAKTSGIGYTFQTRKI